MDIEQLRDYCLGKKEVEESFPFGETTLVFKVADKVFLLASLDQSPLRCNMKCDPDRAIELREQYNAVQPGYHMNKKHWNTIILNGSIPTKEIKQMIDESYRLVVLSLPLKYRGRLIG